MNIVLLAGGEGKRLWPFSKESFPKQFLPIYLNKSTFQLTLERCLQLTINNKVIITCNIKNKEIVHTQIQQLGLYIDDFILLLEEKPNNTAVAIYNACKFMNLQNNDQLTYFFPSDQIIDTDPNFFNQTFKLADDNKINLFGEKTSIACSHFGYMTADRKIASKYYKLQEFIEKPDAHKITILNTQKIYRNLGIYLARNSTFIKEFNSLCPDLITLNLPVDKAITEKSKNLNFFECDLKWQDIGSIEAIYKYYKDTDLFNINITEQDILEFNRSNSIYKIIYSNKGFKLIKSLKNNCKVD